MAVFLPGFRSIAAWPDFWMQLGDSVIHKYMYILTCNIYLYIDIYHIYHVYIYIILLLLLYNIYNIYIILYYVLLCHINLHYTNVCTQCVYTYTYIYTCTQNGVIYLYIYTHIHIHIHAWKSDRKARYERTAWWESGQVLFLQLGEPYFSPVDLCGSAWFFREHALIEMYSICTCKALYMLCLFQST